MFRVGSVEDTQPLEMTSLSERGYLEENLREWILSEFPPILEEGLHIIRRLLVQYPNLSLISST